MAKRIVFTDLFIMVIGGILAGAFLRMLIRGRAFQRDSTTARGTVVARESRPMANLSGGQGRSYVITVRFATMDGRNVTSRIDFAGLRVPKVGQPVRVLYDPRRPENARLDTALGRGSCWQVPAMLFGAVVFAGGAIALIRTLMG